MASGDEWLRGTRLPAPKAHLEAVGAFALNYNALEMIQYVFVRHYFPDNALAAETLFGALHNRARVDLVKTLAANETEDVRDAISHAMACFDLCCENRNLLLHSVADERFTNETALAVFKRRADNPSDLTNYRFSLDEVREAAVSAAKVFTYCTHVVATLKLRALNPGKPLPLPDKPQLPRKLSLSRLTEAPPTAPPPPRPSQP